MKLPDLKKLPPLPKFNLSMLLGLANRSKNTIFILAALLFVAANLLIQPVGLRLDFSKNQANTLSEGSKKVLDRLDQNITIVLFASEDLPAQLSPVKQDVQDILNEYARTGGSKVTLEVKDPKLDEKARQEAATAGIGELRFSQTEQDSLNVSTGFFGILIKAGEKSKPIPQITDLQNLEYNITSGIYNLVKKETAKIAVVSSSASFDMQQRDPLGLLRETLSQQYALEPLEFPQAVPPVEGEELPSPTPDVKEIDTSIRTILLFADQSKTYTDSDVERLNNYIKSNGKVILFMDGVGINEQLLATEEASHNLFGFTRSYGIEVNKDLVLSASSEIVNFGDQVQSLFLQYPYWVTSNVFNPESGIFSNVNFLTFPWVSSITLGNAEGFTLEELIRTVPQTYTETGSFVLDPQVLAQSRPNYTGPQIIGASSTHSEGGKLIVISSSRFGHLQYLSPESGNLNFILNLVSDFASDGSLSGIRQRNVEFYPLPQLSNASKELFKYGNMLGLPLLFAFAGAVYLVRRK